MPIEITCRCGKVFRVRDALAGQTVVCQICGSPQLAPAAGPPAGLPAQPVPPPRPPTPLAAPGLSASQPARTCPACAETIPADAVFCPLCRDSLGNSVDPAHVRKLVQERVAALDDYLLNRNGAQQDAALIGTRFTTRTRVSAGIALACTVLVGFGFAVKHEDVSTVLLVIGFVVGIPALICLLVSVSHDRATADIHQAPDARRAFLRYYVALRTRRPNRAFAALAPSARQSGPAPTIQLEKIPANKGAWHIDDLASYDNYWKSILRGPSMQTRTCRLLSARVVGVTPDGEAEVEATFEFGSYPSLLILLILLNLIVCAIVVAICTKREKRTVRKRLVRRRDRWYVLDGEFEGPADRVAATAA